MMKRAWSVAHVEWIGRSTCWKVKIDRACARTEKVLIAVRLSAAYVNGFAAAVLRPLLLRRRERHRIAGVSVVLVDGRSRHQLPEAPSRSRNGRLGRSSFCDGAPFVDVVGAGSSQEVQRAGVVRRRR